MAEVALLTEFHRPEGIPTIKCRYDGTSNNSAVHFSAPGDDSPPLPSDFAALVDAGGTGNYNAVGYVDVENTGIAIPGEKRIYARDNDGAIVNTLHMKGDGSFTIGNSIAVISVSSNGEIIINNDNGNIQMLTNGNAVFNGVSIDTNGNITTSGTITATNIAGTASVKALGFELALHTHAVTSAPGVTGPNLP